MNCLIFVLLYWKIKHFSFDRLTLLVLTSFQGNTGRVQQDSEWFFASSSCELFPDTSSSGDPYHIHSPRVRDLKLSGSLWWSHRSRILNLTQGS